MKWRGTKTLLHFSATRLYSFSSSSVDETKMKQNPQKKSEITFREAPLGEGPPKESKERWKRRQKQIRFKSFVIKSKLTFRTKFCYPPNLHFALTNTEVKKKTPDKEYAATESPTSRRKSVLCDHWVQYTNVSGSLGISFCILIWLGSYLTLKLGALLLIKLDSRLRRGVAIT